MDIQDRLRTFIAETQSWSGSPAELTADYHLIENGVIDSLGIFQIVTFLEEDIGITIEDDELVPENFSTISSIAAMAAAKNRA